jgi:hypothetical protein
MMTFRNQARGYSSVDLTAYHDADRAGLFLGRRPLMSHRRSGTFLRPDTMRDLHMYRYTLPMAQFVYIDETGSVGKGASKQPYLTLAAVLVSEDKVQPLARAMREIALNHLDGLPTDFEFHGHEIWGGTNWWSEKEPSELIAAFEAAIDLLAIHDLSVVHASINKAELHYKYNGAADENAYLLALQFLLEKIDAFSMQNRIVIADEAKEHQFRAIKMVSDMQQWGTGEVPSRKLKTIVDSLHYVQSNASFGVQMADLVAYILQRYRRNNEKHPDAAAALYRLHNKIMDRTRTWREPWPQPRKLG